MKFLVPNYSCLQNPWLGGHRPHIPVLSVRYPQLNLLNPPKQNSRVRHWSIYSKACACTTSSRKRLNIRLASVLRRSLLISWYLCLITRRIEWRITCMLVTQADVNICLMRSGLLFDTIHKYNSTLPWYCTYQHIQGVPGGMCETSGECSLC